MYLLLHLQSLLRRPLLMVAIPLPPRGLRQREVDLHSPALVLLSLIKVLILPRAKDKGDPNVLFALLWGLILITSSRTVLKMLKPGTS